MFRALSDTIVTQIILDPVVAWKMSPLAAWLDVALAPGSSVHLVGYTLLRRRQEGISKPGAGTKGPGSILSLEEG